MGAMSHLAVVSALSSELITPVPKKTETSKVQTEKIQMRWFKTLPPERIGPNGEYDYYGLSKRVFQHLQDLVGAAMLQRLKVRQRGRVVLLSGYVPTTKLLELLEPAALSIEGAESVESCVTAIEASWVASA